MKKDNDTPANGSVSDVNAADVTNITPENAAVIAYANLNSGTDCATTSDTTMNKSYTTKCSVARHKKPSFTISGEAGHQTRRVEHTGAVHETVYDIYGRVIAESSLWAGG